METKTKTIRISAELEKKIKEAAEKENRTFNNMIETVLLKHI